MIKIDSQMQLGKSLPKFEVNVLKNETMFFSCDLEYAYKNGGEPTKQFIDALPSEWQNEKTILDSRVHMLMKGWFPCIPGFHHDDVPRDRSDKQPDYENPSYRSKHAMVLYNGEVCPTEFAIGISDFPEVPLNEICYKIWHPLVVNKIKSGELKSVNAEADRVLFFDDRTWHQGTPAVKDGWRYFIRVSRDTNRIIKNEVRRQTQVYLTNPMEGW